MLTRKNFPQFLRFCIVGFTTYLVDSAVMETLVHQGLHAMEARAISITIAMQCGYLLHGIFTFRGHGKRHREAWIRYMTSNLIGAALNYAVFVIAFHLTPFTEPLLARQSALICAVGVAMWFNFWANGRFVFGKKDAR